MKKTVKILNEEIQLLKRQLGMTHKIEEHCVWTPEQIADVIRKCDKQNALIKVEITHGVESRALKPSYLVIVWKNTSLEK